MTAHKTGDPLTLNRLYGRSSGHKLRKGHQELVDRLLPKIAVPAKGEVTSRRLFGESARTLVMEAYSLAMLGRPAEAVLAAERAQAAEPGFTPAAELLERLRR